MAQLPNLREESRYIGLPAHVRNVAEVLAEFDRDLYIEVLPSTHPQFNAQKPFSVTHRPAGRESYVIKNVAAADVDARIIAEFIEGQNNVHTGASYDEFDALQKAWDIMNAKKRQEEEAERRELMVDLLKLGEKNHYARHNGRRIDGTVDEDLAPTTLYLGK